MTVKLEGKNLARMKAFLEEPAADWGPDSSRERDPYNLILAWAMDPDMGALPARSARPFADWLSDEWDEWTDNEGATVGEILSGAVMDWCGGRTMS